MKTKKQLLGLLLAVCVVMVQIPWVTRAEESSIYVAGQQLTAGTYYKTTDDGSLTSEGATESNYNVYFVEGTDGDVLTLNNATIEGQVSSSKALEIVLEGNNTITGTNPLLPSAIFVYGSLLLDGNGELTATAAAITDASSTYSTAIKVTGDLTIAGGTITAIGNEAYAASCGIYVEQGILSIEGGTIYANCALEDGSVKVKGGDVASGFSIGIYNGTIKDEGTDGMVVISDGEIYSYGGNASGAASGIAALGNITITGGKVIAVGGTAEDNHNYGIGAEGDVTISGGDVTATGGTATTLNSYGIGATGNVTINSGNVDATGGTATAASSFGVGAEGNLIITGGELNAKGGTAGQYSHGLGTENDITISGGKVTATAGTSTYGFGIGANNSISIIDKSKVTAFCAGQGQAIGAVNDYIFDENLVFAGASAEDASVLETIPTQFADYKYLKAVPGYTVAVNNGNGAGKYAEGDIVTITANEAEAGKQFKEWTVESGEITLADAASSTTTFTMPAEAVEVTATYENISEDNPGDTPDDTPGDTPGGNPEDTPGDTPTTVEEPEITSQPSNVTVQAGNTARFVVAASGENLTYQWKINRNDRRGWVNISGATQSGYTIQAVEEDCNGFQYKCVVSNAGGSVESRVVTLYVNTETQDTPNNSIISGANGSWTKGSGSGYTFIGNGDFSKFTGVKADGSLLSESQYDAEEGSTIITLKPEYLNTLEAGTHIFEILWTDGSASTALTIAAASADDSNNNTDTDNNNSDDNTDAGNDNTGSDNSTDAGNDNAENDNSTDAENDNNTDVSDGNADNSNTNSSNNNNNSNSGNTNNTNNNNSNTNKANNANEKDKVPKTGADTQIGWLAVVALISGAGLLLTNKKREISQE